MPSGLVFDAQDNLYVSDFNNNRILKFSGALGPNTVDPAASSVIGQPNFATRGAPAQVSSSNFAGPIGLSVDGGGNLYVADPNNNRVLVFALERGCERRAQRAGPIGFCHHYGQCRCISEVLRQYAFRPRWMSMSIRAVTCTLPTPETIALFPIPRAQNPPRKYGDRATFREMVQIRLSREDEFAVGDRG